MAGFSSGDVSSFVHDALAGLRQAMAGLGADGAFGSLDDGMANHQGGNDPILAADASNPSRGHQSFG